MNHYLSKNKTIHSFVDSILNHPWRYLLISLTIVLALTPVLSGIKSDFTYRVWFNESDPDLQAFDKFERKFGNDESLIFILHSPSGIFDRESALLLDEVTDKMWQLPEMIRVDSLANYNWVRAEGDDILITPFFPDASELPSESTWYSDRKSIALADEQLPGYLISEDAKTALIIGRVKPNLDSSSDSEKIVLEARKVLKEYQDRGDHSLQMTGPVYLNDYFREVAVKDTVLIPIVIFLMVLIQMLFFRRIGGVLLSISSTMLLVVFSLSIVAALGVKMNSVTSAAPQIIIAIGTAAMIHVLAVFYQFYDRGKTKMEALEISLHKNFIPTLLTSLSTAIGFFSLTPTDIVPINNLGLFVGIGSLSGWLITYFILAPLIVLVPAKQKKPKAGNESAYSPLAEKLAAGLYRFRSPIIYTTILLSIASVVLASFNKVDSNPFEYFPPHSDIRKALDFAEDNVGGVNSVEIAIDSGVAEGVKDPEFLQKVEAYQTWIDQYPGVDKTVSIIDIIKSINRALNGGEQSFYQLPDNQFLIAQELFLYQMDLPQGMDLNDRISVENDATRLTVIWHIHNSHDVLLGMQRMRDKAEELGLDVNVTGKNGLYQALNPKVARTFFTSILIALILVSVLISVSFRSVKLGLFAMIPNIIPMAFGAAWIYLLHFDIDIGTVIVFSVVLGIAVDDTIHTLSSWRKGQENGLDEESNLKSLLSFTSPALVITTVVLVIAFGTFLFANFVPNQRFGILAAIMLSFALLIDVSFLPATLIKKKQ